MHKMPFRQFQIMYYSKFMYVIHLFVCMSCSIFSTFQIIHFIHIFSRRQNVIIPLKLAYISTHITFSPLLLPPYLHLFPLPPPLCPSIPQFIPASNITFYKSLPNLNKIQGVQKKLCFSQNTATPSLAYIAVRDLQSSQRNASVQSLLLVGNLLYNQSPIAAECWRGRGSKLKRILGKTNNI